jgi:hypothetical protein
VGSAEGAKAMAMEVTSMRWPAGVKQELMRLAHQESLRTGRQVSWSQLVRQTVEHYLLGRAKTAE